jgi:hypothetical protein
MISNDGEGGALNHGCCDYLMTPEVNLAGNSGYVLTFRSYFTGNHGQKAFLKMSTDNGQTWTIVKNIEHYPVWKEEVIDLSAYSGSNGYNAVRFAFHADDQDGQASAWAVDDVLIYSDQLAVTGYMVYVNMVYMGQTAQNQFQITPPLSYRNDYTLKITAIYQGGVSPETILPFTSWYLPPPQNFTAVSFDNYIEFSWDPPMGSTTIDHYSLYHADTLFALVPFTELTYVLPCENGEVCLEIANVHNLTTVGYPGQFGESSRKVACGYVDSSDTLQLFEDWGSGSFNTNNWTAGQNWIINMATGNDAPSASHTAPANVSNYQSVLSTWYYDATYFPPCSSGYVIDLYYEVKLADTHATGLEKLQVLLTIDNEVTVLKEYYSDGSFDWKSGHKDLTSNVPGHNFRISFVASGNSDDTPVSWFVDNVNLYWGYTISGSLVDVHAHRTGNPENDILISWDAIAPNACTYILDDNTAEETIGMEQPGELWLGNEMNNGDSGVLTDASVYMTQNAGASANYRIDIFDKNRNFVGSSVWFDPEFNDWTEVDLPDIHYDELFYVLLHIQSQIYSDNIGIDTNGPNAVYDFGWIYDGSSWIQLSDQGVPGVFLIRVGAVPDKDKKMKRDDLAFGESECDPIGYSIYRTSYSSFPPGGNSGSNEAEWIGCTPRDTPLYLDTDLGNDLTNCYQYQITLIYGNHESLPAGSDWDCIFVGLPAEMTPSTCHIYPNPADNWVKVELNSGYVFGKLLDIFGKKVSEFDLNGDSSFLLDTAYYPDGSYILWLQKSDGLTTQVKLIIHH